MFAGLCHYHERGIAYKHLHPENILIRKSHATLRPIDEQRECKIGEDWPFEGVEVANEDLGRPVDVFNFGLLVLWMACMGTDNYFAAIMKFHCNMALIKMTMADDPNQRPLVDHMMCTNSPIFHSNSQWHTIPLTDYLMEVFNDDYNAEEIDDIDEEVYEFPSEVETGESNSDSESISKHLIMEDESGNETTESENPKNRSPSQENADDGNDSTIPNADLE